MRIARVAPGMGITFTVVETFQKWFEMETNLENFAQQY